MIKIFVSYSSNDSVFADRLVNDLNSFDADLFYAKWSIMAGDSIVDKISSALSSHDNLVVILSKSSVSSDWVKKEINSSLMRQLSNKSIRIVPVRIDDCKIPVLLSDIKYADFTDNYQSGFEELMGAFESYLDLDVYYEIISKACPEVTSTSEQKKLALALKKIDPITFPRNEILSYIYDHRVTSVSDLVSKYRNAEFVDESLEKLTQDRLITMSSGKGNKASITTLGENIYKSLNFGFNEGILSPVCSS